jgi:hypothetical protein
MRTFMHNFGLKTILAATLIYAISFPAFGQEEPAFPAIPIKTIVTVEPRHGKDVPNVRAEDIVVSQGKQRDKVISLQPVEASESAIQLFVLIDDSLSNTDIGTKLGEIRSFIASQPSNVETGIAYMRNGTAIIAQNLTRNHEQAASSVRLSIGDGGAEGSSYFALQDLLKRWPQSNATREVVMISDGIDQFWDSADLNDPYVNAAIHDAQRDGVVVNAIYARAAGHFGHTFWRITWGQNFLSELADATGGEAYYLGTESAVTFTPYFNEINERLKHQYLLTFQAQPGKKAGFQRVKVTTEVPNAELVAPSEVYVPTA